MKNKHQVPVILMAILMVFGLLLMAFNTPIASAAGTLETPTYFNPYNATATPSADGALYHTVLEGQSPYAIATLYGIDVATLLENNNLGWDAVINIGDVLLIRNANERLPGEVVATITPVANALTNVTTPSSGSGTTDTVGSLGAGVNGSLPTGSANSNVTGTGAGGSLDGTTSGTLAGGEPGTSVVGGVLGGENGSGVQGTGLGGETASGVEGAGLGGETASGAVGTGLGSENASGAAGTGLGDENTSGASGAGLEGDSGSVNLQDPATLVDESLGETLGGTTILGKSIQEMLVLTYEQLRAFLINHFSQTGALVNMAGTPVPPDLALTAALNGEAYIVLPTGEIGLRTATAVANEGVSVLPVGEQQALAIPAIQAVALAPKGVRENKSVEVTPNLLDRIFSNNTKYLALAVILMVLIGLLLLVISTRRLRE